MHSLANIAPEDVPAHLAIGMFDGVHRGHQAVIEQAVEAARSDGTKAGVLTFTPHPSRIFRPENPTRLLMPLPVKLARLGTLGVDTPIVEPFTSELGALDADQFLPLLRQHLPKLKAVYVGENFRFGKMRMGTPDKLAHWGQALGIHAVSVPSVLTGKGETVSSTRIRNQLEAGEIEMANEGLGYAYFCEQTTQTGRQLGRTLGFPTLNLVWEPELKPCFGVYCVRVMDAQGVVRIGVANYGVRPTLNDHVPALLEVHVLGECPWQSGDRLCVEWLAFIRPEYKFSGLDALQQQIKLDCVSAMKWHTSKH